jgi:spore germination protein GerM
MSTNDKRTKELISQVKLVVLTSPAVPGLSKVPLLIGNGASAMYGVRTEH